MVPGDISIYHRRERVRTWRFKRSPDAGVHLGGDGEVMGRTRGEKATKRVIKVWNVCICET